MYSTHRREENVSAAKMKEKKHETVEMLYQLRDPYIQLSVYIVYDG